MKIINFQRTNDGCFTAWIYSLGDTIDDKLYSFYIRFLRSQASNIKISLISLIICHGLDYNLVMKNKNFHEIFPWNISKFCTFELLAIILSMHKVFFFDLILNIKYFIFLNIFALFFSYFLVFIVELFLKN